MHMADALVSPAVAGTMYVCSMAASGYSIKKVRLENDSRKIPIMGVMGAFVFAAQMINFTIPGTGSSGHLCGGLLLSAILGPCAGFLTMAGVLLVQCLLFADGGLLALGCNIWNMAFYGCFVGVLFLWKNIMKGGISKRRIAIASILGCVITLQLGAFSVTAETFLSGITELPFTVFLGFMQPIHLAVGLVEGLITSAVLCFIYEARPELLWCISEKREQKEGRLSLRQTVAALGILTLFLGGGLSLLASAYPDGLEWSIEKVMGSTALEAGEGIYEAAASIQETAALLPDYGFKNSDAAIGTSFSGVAGALVVTVVCVAGCCLLKLFKKKTEDYHE